MRPHRLPSSRWTPVHRLNISVAAIVAVWLGVLPYVGQLPHVREHIDRNERQGIDPSAKFYTELPAMPVLWDRVESAQRRDGQAFWQSRN